MNIEEGIPHNMRNFHNINIEKFNELLIDHPNQPFVQSVIAGLRDVFGLGPNCRMVIPSLTTSHSILQRMIVSMISYCHNAGKKSRQIISQTPSHSPGKIKNCNVEQ
jgi:hypothetical protein